MILYTWVHTFHHNNKQKTFKFRSSRMPLIFTYPPWSNKFTQIIFYFPKAQFFGIVFHHSIECHFFNLQFIRLDFDELYRKKIQLVHRNETEVTTDHDHIQSLYRGLPRLQLFQNEFIVTSILTTEIFQLSKVFSKSSKNHHVQLSTNMDEITTTSTWTSNPETSNHFN